MLKIKQGSEAAVQAIMYSLCFGPIAPVAMMFNYENVRRSGCSEVHVALVCEQLLLAGAALQLDDGRYIATSDGEEWSRDLEKALADKEIKAWAAELDSISIK
jgi:hypothetical protein